MDREDLLARLWEKMPAKPTADDLLAAENASTEYLAEGLRRLGIIQDIEAGRQSISDVVKSNAYGRTHLYEMRRRWTDTHSLRSLLPYARRDPSRPRSQRDTRLMAAYNLAAEAEAAEPSVSVGAIAWGLARQTEVGFTTLRNMAWRARQRRLGKNIPTGDPNWRSKPRRKRKDDH